MLIKAIIDAISASPIASNLISAGVAGVLGYGARWIRDRVVFRFERRFWSPFASSAQGRRIRTAIVAKEGSAGSLAKVSLTDVQAYSELISELDMLHIKTDMVTPQQNPTLHQFNDTGLICLGGPVANTLSKSLISRFSKHVPISFEAMQPDDPNYAASKAALHFKGQVLAAKIEEGHVETDYALVLHSKRIDPEVRTSGPVLLAFGLRGIGTQEAVRYILRNKRDFVKAPGIGRWVLLKFSFSGVDRTTDEIIDCGPIQ